MSLSKLIAVVTSSPGPQHGQSARSSENFNTRLNQPVGTNNLNWKVVPLDKDIEPGAIRFNVARDVSGGSDPTIFHGLADNSTTENALSDSLYIAKPSGSGPSGFLVIVYAVYE